jgi:hypothetical protein
VLRVDELGKLAGTPCPKLRAGGHGCSIYEGRPRICRAYRCLWLRGGLRDEDRPDRLGAVLDVVARGTTLRLEIRQAERGRFDRSPRLQQIAARHRELMPVRITDVEDVLDPDRPFRVLLAGGVEQRVAGEQVTLWRDGRPVETQRLWWLERLARRVDLWLRQRQLRRLRARGAPR